METLLVKAYSGRGSFHLWSGVARVDRDFIEDDLEAKLGKVMGDNDFPGDEVNELLYGVESYILRDKRLVPKGATPRSFKFFRLVIKERPRRKDDDGFYYINVFTQFGLYIMNREGKTVESY